MAWRRRSGSTAEALRRESGAQLLLGVSRYSGPLARLGRIRSAGITGLRFGNVLDEDWQARDRFAVGPDPRRRVRLPDGVACYAVAASRAPGMRSAPPGDGLVSVDSALGRHRDPGRSLQFPQSHCLVAWGTSHLDLLGSAEVHAAIKAWLR